MIWSIAGLSPEWLLLAALAIDLVFGEVPAKVHPVVWIGSLIGWFVRRLPREGLPAFSIGLAFAILVPIGCAFSTLVVLKACADFPWVASLLGLWILTSSFSVRMLGREASKIARLLEQGQLDEARAGLSHLCSRDPSGLDAQQVAGATVESVAENTSDSYVAPIFWFCLLGVPGAVLFRTVNTMDAMIGYRGEFEYLGKAAARLDDVMCWIPARITALLFLCVGAVVGGSSRRGLEVLVRDRLLTASPNAGFPMAAIAGVLGVRLVKRGEYELGREGGEPGPQTIFASTRILTLTAFSVTSIAVGVLVVAR